jgi:hypothetical protein
MPLQEETSKKGFNSNVEELINTWKKKKKIGTSNPKTIDKARKQALAIAFNKQRS